MNFWGVVLHWCVLLHIRQECVTGMLYWDNPTNDSSSTINSSSVNINFFDTTAVGIFNSFADVIDVALPMKGIKMYCSNVVGCFTNVTEYLVFDFDGNIVENQNCCVECKCDEMCFERGDCCFDLAKNDSMATEVRLNNPGVTCTKTVVSVVPSELRRHNYMLQDKCPDSYLDARVVQGCEYPDKSKMSEMTPYFYRRIEENYQKGENYRNVWCLRCNVLELNETQMVPWDLLTKCPHDLAVNRLHRNNVTYNEEQFLNELYATNCTVVWQPRLYQQFERCYPDVVSTCLFTDNVMYVELCEGFNSVYAPFKGNDETFKNVYCAACNGAFIADPFTHITFFCGMTDGFVDFLNPFTVLLRPEFVQQYFHDAQDSVGDEISGNTSEGKCADGELYMVEMDMCLQVVCSMQDIRVGTECVRVVELINGGTIEYRLDAYFPGDRMNSMDPDDLMYAINEEVILINDTSLNMCFLSVLGSKIIENDIVISYQFVYNVKYPLDIKQSYEEYRVRLQNYESKYNVYLRPSNMHLNPLNDEFSTFATFGAGNEDVTTTDMYNGCIGDIAFVDIQFCQAVVIGVYTELPDLYVVVNNVTLDPHEYVFSVGEGGDTKVRVCLDTLMTKLALGSGAVAQHTSIPHVLGAERSMVLALIMIMLHYAVTMVLA